MDADSLRRTSVFLARDSRTSASFRPPLKSKKPLSRGEALQAVSEPGVQSQALVLRCLPCRAEAPQGSGAGAPAQSWCDDGRPGLRPRASEVAQAARSGREVWPGGVLALRQADQPVRELGPGARRHRSLRLPRPGASCVQPQYEWPPACAGPPFSEVVDVRSRRRRERLGRDAQDVAAGRGLCACRDGTGACRRDGRKQLGYLQVHVCQGADGSARAPSRVGPAAEGVR